MKFHFSHQVVLPLIPVDLAFDRLTSVAYVERVIRLSELASDFELLANEGDVLRYRFVENISALFSLINKRLSIVVKQTRDKRTKTLIYESDVDNGTVTLIKSRVFTPTDDGGTLVSETVDGECPILYQPMTKQQGHKALVEHMSKYYTLFNDV